MNENNEEKCETCRFWNPMFKDNELGRQAKEYADEEGNASGFCRRYPPTPFEKHDSPDSWPDSFARTESSSWCGEYQPKRVALPVVEEKPIPFSDNPAPEPPMTPVAFADEMRSIFPPGCEADDATHKLADDLLCRVLRLLGYGEGVDVFEDAPKWYA